ncbi:DUF2971 domain-containing protein [Vibrio variabilis]|uniref:DUF2971 domain-containing protein n=1 Tax=Vibrio variabilis TaxID=990271 RepID=UPI000690A64F|nr:DUF2971 domain-containing protein [Vibrio variabilis]
MYFKYLPAERLDVLQNLKIRFSPLSELNDPYEVYGVKEGNIVDMGFSNKYDGCLVLSLSRSRNNLLMWSHYADAGAGFVLELDLNDKNCTHIDSVEEKFKIYDVEYRDELRDINEVEAPDLFLTKPKCWEYEEESRIIAMSDSLYLSPPKDHSSSPLFLYDLPRDSIKTIYIGPTATELTQYYIRHYVEHHNLRCKVIKMVMDTNRFGFFEK